MSAFDHEEELTAVLEKMEADSQDPMELMAAVFTVLGNFIDVELVQAVSEEDAIATIEKIAGDHQVH